MAGTGSLHPMPSTAYLDTGQRLTTPPPPPPPRLSPFPVVALPATAVVPMQAPYVLSKDDVGFLPRCVRPRHCPQSPTPFPFLLRLAA